MRKPQIYMAGPYRLPNRDVNRKLAVAAGKRVRDTLDVVASVPHNDLLEQMQFDEPDEYYLAATLDLMRCCDAVYRFSDGFSAGSDAEVAEAYRLKIPVFFNEADLAQWVSEWKEQHAHRQES
jgi:nucleoside 2-deoxyribosyltransferase